MNLIYTLAFGSNCWHQAVLLVNSLRNAGQFTGDILVFSDIKAEMLGAKVVNRPDVCAIFNFISARSYIGKDIDVSGYDKVMMLDSDIVAIAPVQPLFERPSLSAPLEVGAPQANDIPNPFALPEFPMRYGECGFNSGTIVGPASTWNAWSKVMWDKVLEVKGSHDWPHPWYDQPILNHIARTGAIELEPLPIGWVYFFQPGYDLHPDTKLIHVLPGEKERIMRCIYGLTNRPRIESDYSAYTIT